MTLFAEVNKVITQQINEQLKHLGLSSENDPDYGFYCSQTGFGVSVIWSDGYEWHVNSDLFIQQLKRLDSVSRSHLISILRDCQASFPGL